MKNKIVNVFYIFAIVGALVGMFLLVRTEQFTNVDGKLVMNTPMPTATPSMMTITGLVVQKPTRHGNGSGMDTRIKVSSADFSPVELIGEDIIVLLDASALQLNAGDLIVLNNCTINMNVLPLKVENCDYQPILK